MMGAWQPAALSAQASFAVDYEKYTLENGLDVVLHVDRSDPMVAVAVTYHVGSARERPGKTGFAHLFEHLLFLDSEHLGPGGIDVLSNKVGGSMNGSTNRDRTNYYHVIPRDALEKVLWAESDRMGFFIKLAIYFTQVTPTCCGPGLRQTRGAIGVQWSSETRRPRCIQRPPEGRPSSSAGVSSVVGAGPWPGCERAGAGLDGDRNILGLPE